MLKKIKLWWKLHYQSILIFVGISLIISPIILQRNLNNLDEIWNFNFARNIANGLIPYKDFNMVITPLLSFICSIFLKLFGNELFTMRILAILLISLIFFISYKLLKKLKLNSFFIFPCLFLLFYLLKDYICIDYNFANLLFILILIYLELKYFNKNNNNNFSNNFNNNYLFHFFIGILSGCCILFKQSTGAIVAIASISYPILLIKNKIDFKNCIKLILIRILGILIPIILLIIYLLINNAFRYFIDYTILGIKTFSNSISYINLINSNNILIKLLSILIPIFILFSGIYLLIKKRKELFGFYAYSIASLIVIFPISDNIHFLIGIIPFMLLLFYFLFNCFKLLFSKINNNIIIFIKETIKNIILLSLICYIIFSIILLINYFNNSENNHLINYYKNIPISKSLLSKINIIDNYILSQDTDVFILDAEAAIYMIPINKYNKDFDMFNKGNLGSSGEIGQIKKIKNLKNNTKILIKNNKYNLNWQTPKEVINYIKNNYNKIGEINIFDIYEINN